MEQSAEFERIFSDAHVVDIDLSNWDKKIVFYVLADHMEREESGRKPLFAVEFMGVRQWSVTFSRHENIEWLGPEEHIQWMIDDFRVRTTQDGIEINLWGLLNTPRTTIVCDDVRIRQVPLSILDRLSPGWDQPSRGFARPGIELSAQLLGKSRVRRDT